MLNMTTKPAGRPRSYDRELALREAASMFWRHGFSGTSTRMLTAALGISSSSLYAAFGTKAKLFEEAVRTYAMRYSDIYGRAVAEPTIDRVLERILIDSVLEFTRTEEGHPGCMTSSAVMADTSETMDVRAFVAELQRSDEEQLRARIERAVRDGDLSAGASPTVISGLVQTVWHGLSIRADLGAGREELLAVARLTLSLLNDEVVTGQSR